MATYTPANAAEFETVLSSTVVGGDVVVTPKNVTWEVNVVLKEGLGTTLADKVIVRVEDHATAFTDGIRAVIGTDDANCTTLQTATDSDAEPVILGGRGSWFEFYGMRVTSAAATGGTAHPRTVCHVGVSQNVNAYDGGTAAAGSANTITFAVGTTGDWTGFRVVTKEIRYQDETYTDYLAVDRGTIASYNTGTRVATMAANWTTPPTAGTLYDITAQDIHKDEMGKVGFYHCLFPCDDIANDGTIISHNTQGFTLQDCDLLAKVNSGEQKCVATTNSYGPVVYRNNRFRNATIMALFISRQTLTEDPIANLIEQNFFELEPGASQSNFKVPLEFKGAGPTEVRYNVFKGAWTGIFKGEAIGIRNTSATDGRQNHGHRIHHNYVYNCVSFLTMAGTGPDQRDIMEDIAIYDNLVVIGMDYQTGTPAEPSPLQPSVLLGYCPDLQHYHNTYVGNRASKKMTGVVLTIEGVGKSPGLVDRDNVTCEGRETYTIFTSGTGGEGVYDIVAGTGQWVKKDCIHVVCVNDSLSNYPTLQSTNWFVTNQAALEAMMDSRYAITDPTKVSSTDGLMVGADLAEVRRRTTGVEAGTPGVWRARPSLRIAAFC